LSVDAWGSLAAVWASFAAASVEMSLGLLHPATTKAM